MNLGCLGECLDHCLESKTSTRFDPLWWDEMSSSVDKSKMLAESILRSFEHMKRGDDKYRLIPKIFGDRRAADRSLKRSDGVLAVQWLLRINPVRADLASVVTYIVFSVGHCDCVRIVLEPVTVLCQSMATASMYLYDVLAADELEDGVHPYDPALSD